MKTFNLGTEVRPGFVHGWGTQTHTHTHTNTYTQHHSSGTNSATKRISMLRDATTFAGWVSLFKPRTIFCAHRKQCMQTHSEKVLLAVFHLQPAWLLARPARQGDSESVLAARFTLSSVLRALSDVRHRKSVLTVRPWSSVWYFVILTTFCRGVRVGPPWRQMRNLGFRDIA